MIWAWDRGHWWGGGGVGERIWLGWVGLAGLGVGWAARPETASRPVWARAPRKIQLINLHSLSAILEINLIRTDTTLDLSQKAEKGMNFSMGSASYLYY